LFTRLKRCAYAPIGVLALWAVILATSPATANAQAASLARDPQLTNRAGVAAQRVVVTSNDSLWSISARWLGPEATPQQIAGGVERIYALNRKQIGSSPDLIFAGQSLLLPSGVKPQSPEPARAAHAQHTGEPAASNRPLHAANNGSDTAAGPAVGPAIVEAGRNVRQALDATSQPPSLPDLAGTVPVSAVRSPAPNDSSPSLAQSLPSLARPAFSTVVRAAGETLPRGSSSGRELLGGALVAMSSVLALILAVHVVREVWVPAHARRRARENWVREARQRNCASFGTMDPGYAHAAALAFDGHPLESYPQVEENPMLAAEGPRTSAPAGHPANGSALSDVVRKIVRSKRVRLRKTRPLKAKRPSRGHSKVAASGRRLGQARRRTPGGRGPAGLPLTLKRRQ
jgi:hypothetical protein